MLGVNAQTPLDNFNKLSPKCQDKVFPVSSGGSKDEKVSCTLNFADQGLILVAGNTTSEDYAPAANDHAFVYAIDLQGNWKWGKFFYNVSDAISTISGCSIDANGNAVFLGQGKAQQPIIMELKPADGSVLKFISLEKEGSTDTDSPWFMTYGAIYHDLVDDYDGKGYYYAAFIMEDIMEVVKINTADNSIKWTYQFFETTGLATGDVYKNKKIPGMFVQDQDDNSRMYLFGQFGQRATAIKFSKVDMTVDWKTEV